LSQGHSDWGICAVGLMPQDKENIIHLNQQDTLYTVLERSADKDKARIIGSITEGLHAPTAPKKVLDKLSLESIKILSLTITEKGYCYDSNQNLDQESPLIQHDVQNLESPKTAIGYIVSGLKQRKENGQIPFTVVSCDNLPGNGHLTQKLVLQFATLIDSELKTWIANHVTFPNSMVDRITPVTTPDIIETLSNHFDINDAWPVICEDYIQWILEDTFCNSHPPFEDAGVQIVKNVDCYEKMKVRLLNGSHSALSYISFLMGYTEVDIAMKDPLINSFVRTYMANDITPTLPPVHGIDLDSYKETLINRFSNPAISDQVQRLAEDGSQKIPNAILPCLHHQFKNNGSVRYIILALAGWFKYLTAIDEQGNHIEIKDPLALKLTKAAKENPNTPEALLQIDEIFGADLSHNQELIELLSETMAYINTHGVKSALKNALS